MVQNSHRPCPQVIHDPGGAELRGLASRRGPRARELTNGLSRDPSGAWITIQG
jgi:hypothetical protein